MCRVINDQAVIPESQSDIFPCKNLNTDFKRISDHHFSQIDERTQVVSRKLMRISAISIA